MTLIRQLSTAAADFAAEFERNNVRYYGFDSGYDSDTDAWVRQQVQAMDQTPVEPR